MTAFSLYVHIPYCDSKCPYCDFNSYAARTWPEEAYATALIREIEAGIAADPFRSAPVATIFFGGGTPSLFEPRTIGSLLDAIARLCPLEPDVEITLEANPGTVNEERLAGFRAAGANRLSFGVRSCQPALLEALGRRQSADDSRAALAAARRAGFENLSLDLIYAVPGQDLAACAADLDEAIAIAPDHVSAYNLTYEKGTAMHRELRAGRISPAPEELEVALFHLVRDRLAGADYDAYEISNYARTGHAARHNQAYWRGVPYLGVGAGANSFSPVARPDSPPDAHGTRWENLRDPNRYMDAIGSTGAAVAFREDLTRAQAMGEACWLGLRESEGIDTSRFAKRFGEDLVKAFPHTGTLVDDGLVEWRGSRLALTPRGLLLADSVFASYL